MDGWEKDSKGHLVVRMLAGFDVVRLAEDAVGMRLQIEQRDGSINSVQLLLTPQGAKLLGKGLSDAGVTDPAES